jgi:hypothetical protein
MPKTLRVLAAFLILLPAIGCGSSQSPAGSGSPTNPSATPGSSQSAKPFKLFGDVKETPPGFNSVPGARIEIVSGVEAGTATLSEGSGAYSLGQVKGGAYTLRASRDGFIEQTKTVTVGRNFRADFFLYPNPPPGATARCKDKSWSFAAEQSAACTRGGGVAYWVCPGPLCQ